MLSSALSFVFAGESSELLLGLLSLFYQLRSGARLMEYSGFNCLGGSFWDGRGLVSFWEQELAGFVVRWSPSLLTAFPFGASFCRSPSLKSAFGQ